MDEYIIGYIVGIVTTIPFWTACYFLGRSRAFGDMIKFLDSTDKKLESLEEEVISRMR
jgi:hypothetical protein